MTVPMFLMKNTQYLITFQVIFYIYNGLSQVEHEFIC